jgi:hypothetical protein
MNSNLKRVVWWLSFLLYVQIGLIGCQKVCGDPYKSAKEAFIGKWEIVEMGNWPIMHSVAATGYEEYKTDGNLYFFDYNQGSYTSQREYWVDSLLHESITREDGFKLVFDYDYEFIDTKLRLDSRSLMIYNTSIFIRVE